jgi:transposase-like protein
MKEVTKAEINKEFLSQFKTPEDLRIYFSDMFKDAVEQMLEGELDAHLGYGRHDRGERDGKNYRNGKNSKTVQTEFGSVELDVPRDRESSFEPQIVKKRQRMIDSIEGTVMSLYSKGMTTRDIEEQVKEIYGIALSDSTVSRITDRILELVKQWQHRPLDACYCIVWMDGISVKVRENHRVIAKVVYIALGMNLEGQKEVLGLWINETESATGWMHILSDLRERGVEDIFITATDNLKGFTEAIGAIYPKSLTQVCITHQIRNSLRYVTWKDKKEFAQTLKMIYKAPNRNAALEALERLEEFWGNKYPLIIKSWRIHWDKLSLFFDFPSPIRKLMYTTNTIENLNRMIRKYTKNKLIFPNDDAVIKAVFLAISQTSKAWAKPHTEWEQIFSQFMILYPERVVLKL